MLIEDLLKLNRSSRNTIFAVLIIVAMIAVYNWVIVPRTAYLSAAQQYESVTDDLVRKTTIAAGAINIQNEKLNKLHRELEHAYNCLFTSAQADEFFRRLQLLAANTGCTIDSLNFIAPKSGKNKAQHETKEVDSKTVKLTVIGQYDNIVGFLAKLQLNDKKVWIKSLRIETMSRNTGELTCDITFVIYSIVEKESALDE
ncbi:type 4a pilus biogenesis protein PilO [Planctomycetota bacterium]